MLLEVPPSCHGPATAQIEVLHGVDFTVDRRRGRRDPRAPTAPARRRRCGRSARWSPRKGSIVLDGKELAGETTTEIVRLGVAHVPQGRGTLNDLSVEDNLLAGAYVRRDERGRRRHRPVVRHVPAPARAAHPARREPVGWRAADARRRPGADEPAEAAAARRAVARSGAADRAGHLPRCSASSTRPRA